MMLPSLPDQFLDEESSKELPERLPLWKVVSKEEVLVRLGSKELPKGSFQRTWCSKGKELPLGKSTGEECAYSIRGTQQRGVEQGHTQSECPDTIKCMRTMSRHSHPMRKRKGSPSSQESITWTTCSWETLLGLSDSGPFTNASQQ